MRIRHYLRIFAVFAAILMTTTASANSYAAPTFRKSESSEIYYSAATSQAFLKSAEDGYKMLPDNVKAAMEKRGTAYYLATTAEAKAAGLPYANGAAAVQVPTYTVYGSNIKTSDPAISVFVDKSRNAKTSVIHEAGHFVEVNTIYLGLNGYVDVSQKIAAIDKYAAVIAGYDYESSYCSFNTQERFAEAFRIFVTDPYWLAANCPELYQMISDSVAALAK